MSMADRDEATRAVIDGIKELYDKKLKPLEKYYMFDHFCSPLLTNAEFDSKPQVLMIGQYSTGKTSFIRYILGRDFPGQRIGPEPTTDRFVAVMDGPEERVIPGNALAVSPELPYRGLERFGVSFLNKLEGSQVPCPVLRNITIVDTPGVLSGEKQRTSRGYDFVQVCSWFAERADLILLLFDAHKLDISDEFKACIEKLRGHDDKIRCVLNKADQVDRQKLMRVYGALMWSMGKVLKTPEVLRVYVGSFWDEPLYFEDNAQLFEMEERDLMQDLRNLPRNSAIRKINELCKRVRLAKVHAYIIGYIRSQVPLIGREKKQKQIIADLPNVFRTVMRTYNLAPGDFPDIEIFRAKLSDLNFSKFHKLKTSMVQAVDNVLEHDIPRLMEQLPRSLTSQQLLAEGALNNPGGGGATASMPPPPVDSRKPPLASQGSMDNPFASSSAGASNPFGGGGDGAGDNGWELESERAEYEAMFKSHNPVDGQLGATEARGVLMNSGLDNESLRIIWDLSDIDQDGSLDFEEFAVAMYLINVAKEGDPLPQELPPSLVPPSKRR